MDRRVTPPKLVTSPTWGPPPSCKQALSFTLRHANETNCYGNLRWGVFFFAFFFQQKGRRTACSQATCYGRTGCSFLSIGDWRILQFTALNFTAIVRYPMTTMYSVVEPFSKYSPVTLHLSPATRILNKNPGRMNITSPSHASKGRLKLFLGIPKKCFDSVCSTRSDCGNSAIRCG